MNFICADDYLTNLKWPSGSNGPRQEVVVLLRRGQKFRELRVQAVKFIKRSMATSN